MAEAAGMAPIEVRQELAVQLLAPGAQVLVRAPSGVVMRVQLGEDGALNAERASEMESEQDNVSEPMPDRPDWWTPGHEAAALEGVRDGIAARKRGRQP